MTEEGAEERVRKSSAEEKVEEDGGGVGELNGPAVPPVNHAELLQRGGDVVWTHAGGPADALHADVLVGVAVQELQDDAPPVRQVGQTAEIRQRLLWGAGLPLLPGEQVACQDRERHHQQRHSDCCYENGTTSRMITV